MGTAAPTDDLLTTTEVADRLRVTRQTVARWVRGGKIAAHRLPSGVIRIPASAMDSFAAANPDEVEEMADPDKLRAASEDEAGPFAYNPPPPG